MLTAADNKSQGMTLIQKLAQMSMDQYGDDLTDVDPSTGARKKHGKNRGPPDNKIDNSVGKDNSVEKEVVKDNDQNRWAVRVAPPQNSKCK